MEIIRTFFETIYNVPELVRIGGLIGLIGIVFAETGLMVGFFLPGDSLLVTAGLFAAKGDLNIVWLNLALMAAAIVGDATGYWIGRRAGQALYSRPNSFFFRKQHLVKTHEFYEKHGGKTIVIARFVPIIRTFAPVVAGIGRMNYARFAFFNISGGILWVLCFLLGGYYFGNIPVVKRNFHFVIFAIIVISCLPAVIEYLRARRQAGERTPDDISNSARRPLTTES